MRVMIAEDEPAARRKLARLLSAEPGVVLIAEADNGDHALELAATLRPEVCFLDIQMPGLSGLDVATRIAPFSSVVFITAFSEHATQAFDINAVDYLLKPYTRERLRATLQRVRKRMLSEMPELRQRRLELTLGSIKSANAQHNDLRFFSLRENYISIAKHRCNASRWQRFWTAQIPKYQQNLFASIVLVRSICSMLAMSLHSQTAMH
jgi:DNA-binding LytR/AlgR family response regulator